MWEQDWALLGIAPTTELGAIKKAYALKLKVTRPDDDADAYQALRSAYERAQQWARWRAEVPEAASPGAPAKPIPTPGSQPEAAAPAAPADTHPVAEEAVAEHPQDLIRHAEAIWTDQGHEAFMACWPELRRRLDSLPLQAIPEASRAFADWVLQHPAMPSAVLANFEAYFAWRADYRSEQQLGAELAQALHALLDEALPRPLDDPELQAQAAPLFGLDALNAHPRTRWKAWIASAAGAQTLSRIKAGFGEHLLMRLGLAPTVQRRLDVLLLIGRILRWLPLLLVAELIFIVVTPDYATAGLATVGIFLGVMAWRSACALIGAPLLDGLKTLDRAGREMQRVREPSARHVRVGLALLAAGAVIGTLGANWPMLAGELVGGLCIAAGLLAGHWVQTVDRSRALAAALIAAISFFHAVLDGMLAPVTWIALACLWTCASGLAFEERLPGEMGTVMSWLGRPIGNTLAVSDRWGSSLASWVPLVVAAASFATHGLNHVILIWGCWSFACYLLVQAQTALDERVIRWLVQGNGR